MEKRLKKYSCCFFGHRSIEKTELLIKKIKDYIEHLILDKKVFIFLFGCNSEFDELCYKIVSELKEKYPNIKRVYVRAKFPEISKNYEKYLLDKYEETYYSQKLLNSGKACYIERNYEMVEKSEFSVVYYNKEYVPAQKDGKNLSKKSGTAMAIEYALKRGLKIQNFFILKSVD